MIQKGIPFIYHTTESSLEETGEGFRSSAIVEWHRGDYNGVLFGGVLAGTGKIPNHKSKKSDLNGVSIGGLWSSVKGNLNGASLGLLAVVSSSFYGLQVGGIASICDYDRGVDSEDRRKSSKGLSFGGLVSLIEGNMNGVSIGVIRSEIDGDIRGLNLSVFCSSGKWDVKGASISAVSNSYRKQLSGFSYGTLYNHAGSNGRFAFQVGAVNHMTRYNPNGLVIQIGLYNQIGERMIPGLNIRGLRNILG